MLDIFLFFCAKITYDLFLTIFFINYLNIITQACQQHDEYYDTNNNYNEDEDNQSLTNEPNDEDYYYRKSYMHQPYHSGEMVRTKLYVTNFPEDMDQDEMKKLFNQYGDVLECTIMWNQYAFVHFGSYAEAEKALNGIKGVQYKGCKLSVQWSTSSKYQQPKQHQSKLTISQHAPSEMHVTKILERPQLATATTSVEQPKRNSGIAETFDVNSTDDSKLAANSKNAWGKPAVQAQPQPQQQQQQQQQNASWASIMNNTTTNNNNNNSSPVAEVKGKASAGPFKISFSEIVRSSNSGAPLVAPTPATAAAVPTVANSLPPVNLTPPSTNVTPVKANAQITNGTKQSQPVVQQPTAITPSRKQMNETKSLNSAVLNGVKPVPNASSIAKVAPIISAPVAPANVIAANQVSGPKQVFSKTNKMNKSDDVNRIGYENIIFLFVFV